MAWPLNAHSTAVSATIILFRIISSSSSFVKRQVQPARKILPENIRFLVEYQYREGKK